MIHSIKICINWPLFLTLVHTSMINGRLSNTVFLTALSLFLSLLSAMWIYIHPSYVRLCILTVLQGSAGACTNTHRTQAGNTSWTCHQPLQGTHTHTINPHSHLLRGNLPLISLDKYVSDCRNMQSPHRKAVKPRSFLLLSASSARQATMWALHICAAQFEWVHQLTGRKCICTRPNKCILKLHKSWAVKMFLF